MITTSSSTTSLRPRSSPRTKMPRNPRTHRATPASTMNLLDAWLSKEAGSWRVARKIHPPRRQTEPFENETKRRKKFRRVNALPGLREAFPPQTPLIHSTVFLIKTPKNVQKIYQSPRGEEPSQISKVCCKRESGRCSMSVTVTHDHEDLIKSKILQMIPAETFSCTPRKRDGAPTGRRVCEECTKNSPAARKILRQC